MNSNIYSGDIVVFYKRNEKNIFKVQLINYPHGKCTLVNILTNEPTAFIEVDDIVNFASIYRKNSYTRSSDIQNDCLLFHITNDKYKQIFKVIGKTTSHVHAKNMYFGSDQTIPISDLFLNYDLYFNINEVKNKITPPLVVNKKNIASKILTDRTYEFIDNYTYTVSRIIKKGSRGLLRSNGSTMYTMCLEDKKEIYIHDWEVKSHCKLLVGNQVSNVDLIKCDVNLLSDGCNVLDVSKNRKEDIYYGVWKSKYEFYDCLGNKITHGAFFKFVEEYDVICSIKKAMVKRYVIQSMMTQKSFYIIKEQFHNLIRNSDSYYEMYY